MRGFSTMAASIGARLFDDGRSMERRTARRCAHIRRAIPRRKRKDEIKRQLTVRGRAGVAVRERSEHVAVAVAGPAT
jgi:hypothetical protein